MSEKIFISYARPDQTIAEQIETYLREAGFAVFRDTSDIRSGANWDMTIEKALRETDRMVLLLSPASMPYRKEVHREWFYYDQNQKPLHPLYLAKCDLHSRLYAYHYLDAQGSLTDVLKKLVNELKQPFTPVTDLHIRDRVVISETAEDRTFQQAMQALLTVIRDEKESVALTPQQVEQMIKHHPQDLTQYRLGRIAEWSQRRYQLDNRFVQLTMLIDQGEDVQGTRWQENRRFDDLRNILNDIPDPALVLLGSPGSGKSTLLRRLQLDLSIEQVREDIPHLTFFIQLNQYRSGGLHDPLPAPKQWLAQRWHDRYPDLPALADLLEQGRMLFLLDALNEMPHKDAADYQEKIGLWRHFLLETIRDNPGNRVIFSCRSLDYSAPLSSPDLRVPLIRLEPMNDAQVEQFLGVYLPSQAATLWQELQHSPQLDLFRTPYFLKLLTEQAEAQEKLPTGQAGLFTGFVRQALLREIEREHRLFMPDSLLTQRDCDKVRQNAWRTPHELPERGLLIPKLSELAYSMQASRIETEGAQVRIDYDTACTLLNHERKEDILRAGTALNVLDEDIRQEEILFLHQLLQEFFAARRLARSPNPELVRVEWQADKVKPSLAEVLTQIADSDPLPPLPATGWEETTLLAASMSPAPDEFVRAVMAVNLPLAGRCAALQEVQVSETLKSEIQQALLACTQDKTADLRARIEAGLRLGEVGDPRFERRTGTYGDYLMPPLILIPAGEYPIGDDTSGYDDEKPAHTVKVAAFQIGQFPVTNAEYALFIKAGGYENEQWWETDAARAWLKGEGSTEGQKQVVREYHEYLQENLEAFISRRDVTSEQAEQVRQLAAMNKDELEVLLTEVYPSGERYNQPEFWNDSLYNNPNQPVVGICWYEARAYCNWLAAQTGQGFRLPREVEIEAAARGFESRIYAYGNLFDSALCNTFESHIRRTTPIGVFPGSETPEGVIDLSGNTWDWTSSIFEPYPYDAEDGRENVRGTDVRYTLRGGSWADGLDNARAAYRARYSPDYRYGLIGFRVVVSSPFS